MLSFTQNPGDFTRTRKIDIVHTVGLILHMAASGNPDGYAITAQNYFSDLFGHELEAPTKQSVCEARQKLHHQALAFLLNKSNMEEQIEPLWNGHMVRIVDGTKVNTPNTADLREHFDTPNTISGSSFYPQAQIVTVMNSSSGQPVAAEVSCYRSSERDLFCLMLPQFSPNDLFLLDRGLGGMNVYKALYEQDYFFLHRVITSGPNAPTYVKAFLGSSSKDKIISVHTEHEGEEIDLILRLIKGPKDSNGHHIVFVTNLLDDRQYSRISILSLYRKRWGIETMYGHLKQSLNIEKFHSKTYNGVMQEIYAHLLIISLSALISCQSSKKLRLNVEKEKPNFKAAIKVIRRHIYRIIGTGPISQTKAREYAEVMVDEVGKILMSAKKQPGRSYPRVSKQSINKWTLCKYSLCRKIKKDFRTVNA